MVPDDLDIRRKGHAWKDGLARFELLPEKLEMIKGKLFWNDEERLTVLALLLENVGVDRAVRLGDPRVWREAIDDLGKAG